MIRHALKQKAQEEDYPPVSNNERLWALRLLDMGEFAKTFVDNHSLQYVNPNPEYGNGQTETSVNQLTQGIRVALHDSNLPAARDFCRGLRCYQLCGCV